MLFGGLGYEDNYPPYNIERFGEDHYRISLAVAGFGVDDITVTAEQNTLTIEGRKPEGAAHEYLYRASPHVRSGACSTWQITCR